MPRVLSVKCPNCGAQLSLNPQVDQATCDYCGHTSLVRKPTLFRRAPPPPPRAPNAPPQLVINVPRMARTAKRIAITSTLLPLLLGFGIWYFVQQNVQGKLGMLGGSGPTDHFFQDATPIPTRLERALGGPVSVKSAVIYPEYAIVEAQNPRRPNQVDRYDVRNGGVGKPTPIRLSKRDQKQLSARIIPLTEVDFAILPQLLADAVGRLGYEGGKVSHVILDHDSGERIWRIYVSGPRDSGRVEYDLAGKLHRMYQ